MAKRYKCPYCEKRLERDKLITHVEDTHEDMIPQNHTPRQVVFNSINKKTHGTCVICGKDTDWNEKAGKYNRLCNNPKCRETMREEFKRNAMAKDGTYNYTANPEFQEKMLKGRKISSTYKFTDGGKVDYVGSYEKKFLEFVDKVMNIESKDIIGPGPTIEYRYEGETHYWITDFYYVPANLVLDIKDGGKNPNNRPMEEYREKQIAKEDAIRKLKKYNYLRLTDNDFSQFMEVLVDLKSMALDLKDRQLVTQINESDTDWIVAYNKKIDNLSKKYDVELYARATNDDRDKSSYQKFLEEDKVNNMYDITKVINENTYVVSDLHIGKERNYDNKIIKFLNKIPQNGNLLILGDIGYIKNPDQEYLSKYFSKIKCNNIYLVLGNHDAFSLEYYYNLGIKGIYEKIFIPNKKWVFSHQPCDGPGIDWINFHGHIHEESEYHKVKDTTNKINCFYKYFDKPLTIRELLQWNETNGIEKTIVESGIYEDDIIEEILESVSYNNTIEEITTAMMTIPPMRSADANVMVANSLSGAKVNAISPLDFNDTILIDDEEEGIKKISKEEFRENYTIKDQFLYPKNEKYYNLLEAVRTKSDEIYNGIYKNLSSFDYILTEDQIYFDKEFKKVMHKGVDKNIFALSAKVNSVNNALELNIGDGDIGINLPDIDPYYKAEYQLKGDKTTLRIKAPDNSVIATFNKSISDMTLNDEFTIEESWNALVGGKYGNIYTSRL